MPDNPVIAQLLAYLPPDRAEALLSGRPLPTRDRGAVLFSDISGFTPLTELVIARYGARLGGEHFTDRLNAVYDALITQVERFGGSILGFAGDAMVVWFSGDDGSRAITTALAMQRTMVQFESVRLPDGDTVSLGMKVAVCTGDVRRFAVGDQQVQCFDVIAGALMDRVAACESMISRGEIAVDSVTARRLGSRLGIREWRALPPGQPLDEVALVASLADEVEPAPRAPFTIAADASERLRPWLAPEVARRISMGQDVFLTELRPATALFTRFAGIDFENDPAAAEKLDGYVRWLQEVIGRLEGVLVQLTLGEKGSYFYAVWGAPIAHDDDAMRACTAALEIVRPPPEIAALITCTQIGVTYGTMRAGAYGNVRRRTYGVLGDDTNLAARLMTKAGPNEILISSHTARRQTDMFDLVALPPVTVKGKKAPVPVFRLSGRKGFVMFGDAPGQRHATPMIGRQRELALAVDRLGRAKRRRGQVVSLVADAGMGKTRLLAEVVREARAMGFAVFAGDCPVLARDASYSVWIPIWRAFFQIPPDIGVAAALARLEKQLAAIDPELKARAPLLGVLLNLALPDSELTRTLDPKVRRASLEGLVVECVRHRARARPLLFVLEEAHWIDDASRSLLWAMVHAATRLGVAIVLPHRPVAAGEILGPNQIGLDYVTTIELGDLPPQESRQLVEYRLAGFFGPGVPTEAIVERIVSRAAGNPFFIEEVINLLKASGANPRDAARFEDLELPESLHSLVLGRIDQLTNNAQSTLKVASVIGRHFRVAVLFGVHPLERVRADLPAQLAELNLRDIALPEPIDGDEAYLFKHVVIQEVAYDSLPYAFRSATHEMIGGYLERAAGEDLRPFIDLLAFHYDRTGNVEKKRRYLVAAGDAARHAYALPSAISYYERALPVITDESRADVLIHLGEVLELAGRWNDAFARYREAREHAHRFALAGRSAAVAGAIGDLHRKRGEFAEAETWITRARHESAELGDDAAVALMLHLEATLCAQLGNFGRATELYEQALAIRERLGDETAAAKTLNNLGIVMRSRGDIDTALRYYERSLAIRRRLNDRREIANSLNNLGFTHRIRKEYDRARALLEESVQMNRSVGDRWSVGNALSSLAELALDTRDADLALRCLSESITINRELGDRRALAFLLEGYGRLAALKDNAEAALMFFAAAAGLRVAIGAPLEPADAENLRSRVDQVRRDLPPAVRERIEADARAQPLGEVLDAALTTFAVAP